MKKILLKQLTKQTCQNKQNFDLNFDLKNLKEIYGICDRKNPNEYKLINIKWLSEFLWKNL